MENEERICRIALEKHIEKNVTIAEEYTKFHNTYIFNVYDQELKIYFAFQERKRTTPSKKAFEWADYFISIAYNYKDCPNQYKVFIVKTADKKGRRKNRANEIKLEEKELKNVYFIEKENSIISMVPKQSKKTINSESTSNFLHFKKTEVNSFINAIKTKPFVILAGISGTGKTQLARAVARDWVSNGEKNNFSPKYSKSEDEKYFRIEKVKESNSSQITFTPVRPDWTDNKKIWGYFNPIENKFYKTEILKLVLEAKEEANKNKRYFIILDEMNLARVEYYFSDILSLMESPEETIELHNKGEVVDDVDPILEWTKHDNITIIGTVNVDETTFSFAPKVLDRAFVLEFLDVDYKLLLNKDEDLFKFCDKLKVILEPINLHFGYRTVVEMKKYIEKADGTPENHFDFLLKSKVLPKLHGTISDLELPLKQLFIYCKEGNMKLENDEVIKKWEEVKDKKDLNYPESGKKIRAMINRLEGTGFTSFF